MDIASTLNLQIFQKAELPTFLILRSSCTWCKLLVKYMRTRGPWCYYFLIIVCTEKVYFRRPQSTLARLGKISISGS